MNEDLHQRLVQIRKRANMSQTEAAEKLGMSRTTYIYAEKYAQRTDMEFLNKFAKLFGVSPSSLIDGSTEQKRLVLHEPARKDYFCNIKPFTVTRNEEAIINMYRQLSNKDKKEVFNYITEIYNNSIVKDKD